MKGYFAAIVFSDFIRHYRKMDAEAIVSDVQRSMDDLEELNEDSDSFGAFMVATMQRRIAQNREKNTANGKKGGRPRKSGEPARAGGSGSGNAPADGNPCDRNLESPSARDDFATAKQQHAGGAGADGDLPAAPGESFHNTPGDAGKSAVTSYTPSDEWGGSARPAGAGVLKVPPAPEILPAKPAKPAKRGYGAAGNVMMTEDEREKLDDEFGDASPIVEELSDYLQQHPRKYKSHYAAARAWCRRRQADGRAMDGKKLSQGDRLALHFARRELEIMKEAGNG